MASPSKKKKRDMTFHQKFAEFAKWVYQNKDKFGKRCKGFCRNCIVCDWHRLVEEVENMEEGHYFGSDFKI